MNYFLTKFVSGENTLCDNILDSDQAHTRPFMRKGYLG